ncbi:MAG: acyl-CoA dehydrogenase family protein, partial [Pseudomonadota bacterium]
MDLSYSQEEEAFRQEVRTFLEQELPEDISEKVRLSVELEKTDMERWHAILNTRGWLAITWPKEYGGTGWNAVERHIFDEECAMANAPRLVPFGLNMLGP